MATLTTPDVYVQEIPAFPPSVAEVGSAIPAFVGYTEIAKDGSKDLTLVPKKIYSLNDYVSFFGGPPGDAINVVVKTDAAQPAGFRIDKYYTSENPAPAQTPTVSAMPTRLLYWSIKLFFDNGGAECYVVSAGNYQAGPAAADLTAGLDIVKLEDEPTLLVVPDAVKLTYADYQKVAQSMLKQCVDLGDRFAILDVYGGNVDPDGEIDEGGGNKVNVITASRDAWVTANPSDLKYGAAYYPFLKTNINDYVQSDNKNVNVTLDAIAAATLDTFDLKGANANTKVFNLVKATVQAHFFMLPPSGAIAGIYAAVDGSRGVWKAPANVGLTDVLAPVVKIDNLKQGTLNVDAVSGKSINVIRAFTGKGNLVWGARTLLGNDNEWRYISVRRFFIMVEESCKDSTYWAVFEPNDSNLWVKVRGMIENYLIDKWREGALAGATPKDAFYVKCGLGVTMTAQDILQGFLNVEIGMAVVRPAEFIVLKFSHKLQTS